MLQGAGLLLGTPGQVVVALGNLRAGAGHTVGALAHIGHDACQRALHGVQRAQQRGSLVLALGVDGVGELALGNGLGMLHGLCQRTGDGAREQQRGHRTQQQRQCQPCKQQHLPGTCVAQGFIAHVAVHLILVVLKVLQGFVVGLGQRLQVTGHGVGDIFLGRFARHQLGAWPSVGFAALTHFGKQGFAALGTQQAFHFFLRFADACRGGVHLGLPVLQQAGVRVLQHGPGADPVLHHRLAPLHGGTQALRVLRGHGAGDRADVLQAPDTDACHQRHDQQNQTETTT